MHTLSGCTRLTNNQYNLERNKFFPLTAFQVAIPRVALLNTTVIFTFTYFGTIQPVVNSIIIGRSPDNDQELSNKNISWTKTVMGNTCEYVIQVSAILENNGTEVYWILNSTVLTNTSKLILVAGM